MNSLTIQTGARLHFGLLVAGPPDRRSYGGVGLMIDQPGFRIHVQRSNQMRIVASADVGERIVDLLPRCWPSTEVAPLKIHVDQEIPSHAGFGSGTQLGLALASALSRLAGELPQSIEERARRAGRSVRSLIGTLGFEQGGLICHGDLADEESLVPTMQRTDFPVDWRFVLITPPGSVGLSGESEKRAFREAPPMSPALLRSLVRLQGELMQSAALKQFEKFSDQLYEFGQRVGKYFSPLQGGVFASPQMEQLAVHLRDTGVRGVGQTSWGPTLFAVCENAESAQGLISRIHELSIVGASRIVSARNAGCYVTAGDSESDH